MMASWLDWTSQEFYSHLVVAGVVLIVVALALYALPGARLKVPGIALSIVGGLGVGLALGVILMASQGYQFAPLRRGEADAADHNGGQGPGVIMVANAPMMGGRGPNYKAQLTALVGKLDALTEKPLTVRLSDQQRKELQEQLKGLADAEELTDDEAGALAKQLHELLEDQRDMLEAAGYRWPEQGGRGGGRGAPAGLGAQPLPATVNPFKNKPDAEHLKALKERLDKSV